MLSRYLTFLILVLFTSCTKEFLNPYDPATPADVWMPRDFRLDTLGFNTLKLSWEQDEKHIDGFRILKTVNSNSTEYNLPKDSLRFIDWVVVDTSSKDICPEVRYKVMATAGNNRSAEIGNTSALQMPISSPAYAGDDILINDTTTMVLLNAVAPNAGESGQWSIVSGSGGSFENERQSNTRFIGTSCNTYVLRWTKLGCSGTYDNLNVSLLPLLTVANAGNDQGIISNSTQVTLAANTPAADETGIWSIISGVGGNFSNSTFPNSTFSGNACTNYVLRWTISGNCSSSIDELNVNFQKATTYANAGIDQTITNGSTEVVLAANSPAAGEIGTWSIVFGTGGSFSNLNLANSTFTGNTSEDYILRWTIQGLCSTNYDDVVILFN
jgi:hypothetical protein